MKIGAETKRSSHNCLNSSKGFFFPQRSFSSAIVLQPSTAAGANWYRDLDCRNKSRGRQEGRKEMREKREKRGRPFQSLRFLFS